MPITNRLVSRYVFIPGLLAAPPGFFPLLSESEKHSQSGTHTMHYQGQNFPACKWIHEHHHTIQGIEPLHVSYLSHKLIYKYQTGNKSKPSACVRQRIPHQRY